MAEENWFREGLRFACSQCGDCCTGAPGYVWVNAEEINALARRFGLTVKEFERKYVRRVGIRKSLIEHSNGDCVFFDGEARKCTVYEDRPRQCKSWPFWESNVRSEKTWEQTCGICPGSGQGKLVTEAEILKQVAMIRV